MTAESKWRIGIVTYMREVLSVFSGLDFFCWNNL